MNINGLSWFSWGMLYFIDDKDDILKINRIHHWMIGLLMMILGGIDMTLQIKDFMEELRSIKEIPIVNWKELAKGAKLLS